MDSTSAILARGSSWLGVLMGVVMIISLLLGVFFRYVLGDALVWSGEVAKLTFVWTVFLIGSSLVRSDGHVRVNLLIEMLPDVMRELVERMILTLMMVLGLIMLWYGAQFAAFTAGQTLAVTGFSMWWRNAAVPVGGGLIAFHAAVLITSRKRVAGRGGVVHE